MTWGNAESAVDRDDTGPSNRLTSLEVCAGAGGLALGLEQAGFDPVLLLDHRSIACETLRDNRPHWDVREIDLHDFDPVDTRQVYDVSLLSGGLPRVKSPATVARTRGDETELSVLKAAIDLIYGVQPRAVLLENVPDLVRKSEYAPVRQMIGEELDHLGYRFRWDVLNAKDYGVPQSRDVGLLVAFKGDLIERFEWPRPHVGRLPTERRCGRRWVREDGPTPRNGSPKPTRSLPPSSAVPGSGAVRTSGRRGRSANGRASESTAVPSPTTCPTRISTGTRPWGATASFH
jgi:DNA (cytosine-5)-methyltransferase 1